MRKTILLLFALTLASVTAAYSPIPDQVISSQEIKESGYNRLSDIYYLLDNWNYYTIDGYTWHSSPGNNELLNNDWLLMVDGKRIYLESLEGKNLNHLPINIVEIDSIVVFNRPMMYEGFFASDGIISITTKKPKGGISYEYHYMKGNETKDPGPYRYIEEKHTPNVDKMGVDYANVLSMALKNGYIRVHAVEQGHFNTDPNITNRMTSANSGQHPKMEIAGYSADALVRTPFSDISVFFYKTTHDDFYESHVNTYTIPVESYLHEVAMEMISNTREDLVCGFRLNYAEDKLGDKPENPDGYPSSYDYNWDRKKYEGSMIFQFNLPSTSLGFTGGIRKDAIDLPLMVSGVDYSYTDFYINSYLSKQFNKSTLTGGIRLNHLEDEYGYKLFSQFDRNMNKYWQMSLAANYAKSSVFESPEFWVLRTKGWNTIPEDFYQSSANYNNEPEKKFEFNFLNRLRLSDKINLHLNASYSDYSGYDFDYSRSYGDLSEVPGPYERLVFPFRDYFLLRSDKKTLRLITKINHQISRSFKQQLFYRYSVLNDINHKINYSSSYDREYTINSHTPRHIINYSLVYSSQKQFTAGLFFRWQSKSQWGYMLMNEPDATSFFNLNASVSKGFWEDRIRLTFLGQNLLDDGIQYHPLGAGVYDFSIWTKLDIYLNSGDLIN